MKSKQSIGLKAAAAVVTATGILVMAGAAQAVALNPDGLGQVLIYPYYTVRANADGNAYDSLLTVINAKNVGKAVRVRFREGKAGKTVLDFNLYLSPKDVWTAAITQTPDSTGAMIRTWDTSCTNPSIPADGATFWSYLFSGANADGEDATVDRTKEGYVEMIEMAEIAAGSPTERAIAHAVGGIWKPRDCSAIQEHGSSYTNTQPPFAGDLRTPAGGLFGNMTLINVNTARAVGYDAVALSGFYKGGDAWGHFGGARVLDTLWFPFGRENPNLSMAFPATSMVFDDGVGIVESAWTGSDWVHEAGGIAPHRSVFEPGLDAVSSVLMRSSIINEFNNNEVYVGATDWVITVPTKNLYFDRGDNGRGDNSLKPRRLFQREFRKGGAVDDVERAIIYDREERGMDLDCQWDGLPPANCDQRPHFPWTVNALQFRNSNSMDRAVFHSVNRLVMPLPYSEGWAQIDIGRGVAHPASTYGDHTLTADTPSGRKFTGLPVVGFAATLYNNAGVDGGSLGRVWASYVGTVPHRYERKIE
ncbi:MAG: hypothetical protein LBI16_04300 [Burkholderiales bacterium]|nr:hypothetical protein [Burkholderiales bacterium]